MIKGRPKRVQMMWPRIGILSGASSFCLREKRTKIAQHMALIMAHIFPQKPSTVSLSPKKSSIPEIMMPVITQSKTLIRSPRIHPDSRATYTGAVSCKKMALAAVVNLVAMTKVISAPANPKLPTSVSNDAKWRGLPRKGSNTAAANRLRNPDIDMGDQDTELDQQSIGTPEQRDQDHEKKRISL